MAPDCYHMFMKGEGVFSSVSAEPMIPPKLRVLYECLPIAFLTEKAGGKSSYGHASLLDLKITALTQKSDIIVGSAEEVERVEKYLAEYSKKE